MLCPLCKATIKQSSSGLNSCLQCGAQQAINPASGNMIWKKNGRVVLADQDVREQIEKAEERYPDCDFGSKPGE